MMRRCRLCDAGDDFQLRSDSHTWDKGCEKWERLSDSVKRYLELAAPH